MTNVYNSDMRTFVFKLLNNSVGKVLRLFQNMLVDRQSLNRTLGLHERLKEAATVDSAGYVLDKMERALIFTDRHDLWRYCLENSINQSSEQLIVEFGVHSGHSINYISDLRPLSSAAIFGFDSFRGLEEDWHGFVLQKGAFDLNGVLPLVRENVTLVSGWFEESLPEFLNSGIWNGTQISLLHMDADTYKPTIFVLNALTQQIKSGTIIIFDEYFNYPSWRSHEFKAFQEFISLNGIGYMYIAYTEMQVAIRIL